MIEYVVLLSIPGLKPSDVCDPRVAPTLYRLMHAGGWRPMAPTFPCLTSTIQASMLTGVEPARHGIIANGSYGTDKHTTKFWSNDHSRIQQPTFFNALKRKGHLFKSAVIAAQHMDGSDAQYVCSVSPSCHTQPPSFQKRMTKALGPFPTKHYWGPSADIKSTQWICNAALWIAKQRAPKLQVVRLPHLTFAGQRHGPGSTEATTALSELDSVLNDFIAEYDDITGIDSTAWIIAGEYAMNDVRHVAFPNRLLRDAGLLKVIDKADGEHLDIAGSDAFALVDHQLAQVYVHRGDVGRVAEMFRDADGVADVVVGRERAGVGLEHDRAAPIILISEQDSWFAYHWWEDVAAAPAFARTVDPHNKPGHDPCELFAAKSGEGTSLDTSLVKGSCGIPARRPEQHGILMCTQKRWLAELPATTRDIHVYKLLCRALDV